MLKILYFIGSIEFQNSLFRLQVLMQSIIYYHQFIIFLKVTIHMRKNYLLCLILVLICQSITRIPVSDYAAHIYQTEIPSWVGQCKSTKRIVNGIQTDYIEVQISEFTQNLLPKVWYNSTKVYGYGCQAINPITGEELGFVSSSPGPTIKGMAFQPTTVNYTNTILSDHMFNVDWSLLMDPYKPINISDIRGVPTTVHAHGQMVNSKSDGYPSSYTTAYGTKGPFYNTVIPTPNNSFVFQYPNLFSQATLFYHDHAIGFTRLNVYAGMSGFYLIQSANPTPLNIFDAKHDIPIHISDRTFNTDGSLYYPDAWVPETLNDVILINGVSWPFMKLQSGIYRFRLINACNARMVNVTFQFKNQTLIPYTIVKVDANYLQTSYQAYWVIMFPGERYEIVINLEFQSEEKVYMMNNQANFTMFNPIDPTTTANMMRIDISPSVQQYKKIELNLPILSQRLDLGDPAERLETLLMQRLDAQGNVMAVYIDGHQTDILWRNFQMDKIYQLQIINLTIDPHPMHIHLISFQIQRRYDFDNVQYKIDLLDLNGPLPFSTNKIQLLNMDHYNNCTGCTSHDPFPYQSGNKEMLQVYQGQVTVVRLRFSLLNGQTYPIDVVSGPGYVFHCHILQHEENSMMVMWKINAKNLHEIEQIPFSQKVQKSNQKIHEKLDKISRDKRIPHLQRQENQISDMATPKSN